MGLPSALGIYLHIPFCRARCGYCDFVTFTGKEDQLDAYVDTLVKEVALYENLPELGDKKVVSIFFGGGTPSLLQACHIEKILGALKAGLDTPDDVETTMEANPESLTEDSAKGWRAAGVNRLSIGLQAFDDPLLKRMGRLHDTRVFLEAYRAARSAGFANINIDLIYGLPTQSLQSWEDTLDAVVSLAPEHISAYALQVEEHTPFVAEHVTIDNDVQSSMYAAARQRLPRENFSQYEISNFSKPGFECRHNLVYWRQEDYLGLGVAAVGTVGSKRWTNHKNLSAYTHAVINKTLPYVTVENLTERDRMFENLMLGLRLREGMVWPEAQISYAVTRDKLMAQGHLERTDSDRWRIPDKYVPLSNQILMSFLD